MYADQDSDHIMFQFGAQGGLNLLETNFTTQLDKEVHAFLSKCDSIPAFLSHITLELFNKRTFHLR